MGTKKGVTLLLSKYTRFPPKKMILDLRYSYQSWLLKNYMELFRDMMNTTERWWEHSEMGRK